MPLCRGSKEEMHWNARFGRPSVGLGQERGERARTRRTRLLGVGLVGVLLASASVAEAATRDVYPGQSIATAVAASARGDTVVVHAGSYSRQTMPAAKAEPRVTVVTAPGEVP